MSTASIRRSIRLLTPAFVAGAQPRASQEEIAREGLRYSYVQAGMRWWFRALAGGVLGTQNIPSIRRAESLIFGTQKTIEIQRAGQRPLRLEGAASRLRGTVTPLEVEAVRFDPRGHRDLAYLAFGMQAETGSGLLARCYLAPGSRFQVAIRIDPPRVTGEPEISSDLVGSLLDLWIAFGGLGARWRHGLGGMEREGVRVVGLAQLDQSIGQQLAWAQQLVREFLQAAGVTSRRLEGPLPVFPVLHNDFLFVKRSKASHRGWEAALTGIKRLWRGSRQADPTNPQSSTLNREVYYKYLFEYPAHNAVNFGGLGLPIPFQFPQFNDQVKGVVRPAGDISRRASPVWFRLRRVRGDQAEGFAILALYWRAVYLPNGTTGCLSGRPGLDHPVQIDCDEAQAWFANVLRGWQNVPVG
ncbi:MAG: RAMP superfamily CRISPR-associated protein [Bryobacteraceae bacterium]